MTEQETAMVPAGLEYLEQGDIIFPRLRLVQPVSRTPGGSPGEFVNDLTGETFRERRVHVARYQPGRAMWQKGSDVPLCVSRDGKVPDPAIEKPFAEQCEGCPQQEWGDDKVPPPCAKTYSFLVLDLETELPCILQVHKTSAQAGKKILTYAWLNKIDLNQVACTIASKEVRDSNGVYYVVSVSEFARATSDAADQLAASEQ